MNVSLVLAIVAAGQAVFVAALLAVHRTGNRVANRLLAAFFLIFAFAMAKIALYASGLMLAYPHLARVTYPLELLHGPLFYLYTRVLTGHRLRRRALVHALPALAGVVVMLPSYLASPEVKVRILAGAARWDAPTAVLWLGNWGVLTAYLVAALGVLRGHGRRLRDNLSAIGAEGLAWLGRLALVLLAGQAGELAFFAATLLRGPTPLAGALTIAAIAVMVFVLAFFALRQPELRYVRPERQGRGAVLDPATGEWRAPVRATVPAAAAPAVDAPAVVTVPVEPDDESDAGTGAEGDEAARYRRSGLGEAQAGVIEARVRDLMRTERLFLRSDLALVDLAELVPCPTHHLSQVLNVRLGTNFFDFVNRYRVEEAQRLLADPRLADRSVLTLAFDAGFNSKSAFNAAFKAATGTTPTAWRREAAAGAAASRPRTA